MLSNFIYIDVFEATSLDVYLSLSMALCPNGSFQMGTIYPIDLLVGTDKPIEIFCDNQLIHQNEYDSILF